MFYDLASSSWGPVDGVAGEAGTLEHLAERHAAPAGDADRAELPGRAGRRRALPAAEQAPPVAGTFDERGDGAGGKAQEVVERELAARRIA